MHGEMGVAVARDLVTGDDDRLEQLWVRAGRHAQYEERRARVKLVEQCEQGVGLAGERRPGLPPV